MTQVEAERQKYAIKLDTFYYNLGKVESYEESIKYLKKAVENPTNMEVEEFVVYEQIALA